MQEIQKILLSENPFEVFGIKPKFDLDIDEIEDKYFEMTRKIHPDHFSTADLGVKNQSQQLSAKLNEAFLAIKNKESRIDTLLKVSGFLKDSESQKSSKPGAEEMELAEEFFDLQELSTENEEKFKEQSLAFEKKLDANLFEIEKKIEKQAQSMSWSEIQNSDFQTQVHIILSLRNRKNYVNSLKKNLERLIEVNL